MCAAATSDEDKAEDCADLDIGECSFVDGVGVCKHVVFCPEGSGYLEYWRDRNWPSRKVAAVEPELTSSDPGLTGEEMRALDVFNAGGHSLSGGIAEQLSGFDARMCRAYVLTYDEIAVLRSLHARYRSRFE